MLNFMGPAAAAIVSYFIKTTILLAPALLAARLAKRRPAAFRHFLLSFALIGLLFVPVVSLLPFGWRTPFLPAAPARERADLVSRQTSADHVSRGWQNPVPSVRDISPDTAERLSGEPPAAILWSRLPPSDVSPASAASGATAVKTDFDRSSWVWFDPAIPSADITPAVSTGLRTKRLDLVLAFIWFGGFAFLLLRLALGLAGAVRMSREGAVLDGPVWKALLLRYLSLISLRRPVRLRSHPEILIPMTYGWRRPVILLPDGAEEWAETERSAALFHELSHIKRADFLFLFLVRLSLSLFWWNPLCWIVGVRIRREQEIACDELVLRAGIKPSTYAAGLLAFRRSAGIGWNPSATLPGLIGRSSFQERLAAILRQKHIIKEVNVKARIFLAAAVVLAVALIGSARPAVGIESKTDPAPAPAAMMPPSPVPASPGQEVKVATATVSAKDKEKVEAEDQEKIEITIVRDGKEKRLVLTKPLTISGGKDGAFFILDKDGKEIESLKGKTWSLEIKGGRALRLDKAHVLTVDKDGDKVVVFEKSGDGKIDAKTVTGIRIDEGEGARITIVDGKPLIAVGKEIKIDGKNVFSIIEPGKDSVAVTVTDKDGEKPVWVTEARPGAGWTVLSPDDKDLLEKVKALREQAAAVKSGKLDIAELEKSLEKLESGLKDTSGGPNVLHLGKYHFGNPTFKTGRFALATTIPDHETNVTYYVMTDKEAKDNAMVVSGDKGKAGTKAAHISGTHAREGTIMIVLTGRKGEEGKAAYERAETRLKKELPQGYEVVESNRDEESGAVTFRIEAPADKKNDIEFIRKVVDALKDEIKK